MTKDTHKLRLVAPAVAIALIASMTPIASPLAATATSTTLASTSVGQICIVAATPLAFGVYDPTSATPKDGQSTISVTCTMGITYTVGLSAGAGSGASTSVRKMTYGSNTLNYSLYQSATYSSLWGNAIGTDTAAGTGTGLVVNHTVYGRIPAQQIVPLGAYADTVSVVVTY